MSYAEVTEGARYSAHANADFSRPLPGRGLRGLPRLLSLLAIMTRFDPFLWKNVLLWIRNGGHLEGLLKATHGLRRPPIVMHTDFPVFEGYEDVPQGMYWQLCAKVAKEHGLRLTARTLERIGEAIDNPTRLSEAEFLAEFVDLGKRTKEELDSVSFLYLEESEAALYEGKEPLFGGRVADRFRSANEDISEAARCFALSRYTASVFHLMRTLEVGLRALSLNAGISEHNPTWKAALDRIHKVLREQESPPKGAPKPARLPKARLQFLSEAAATLDTFKTAWRNKTTHDVETTYSEERARDIMNAVGAFMRHLATELTETP